jgi:hypothetical protein
LYRTTCGEEYCTFLFEDIGLGISLDEECTENPKTCNNLTYIANSSVVLLLTAFYAYLHDNQNPNRRQFPKKIDKTTHSLSKKSFTFTTYYLDEHFRTLPSLDDMLEAAKKGKLLKLLYLINTLDKITVVYFLHNGF